MKREELKEIIPTSFQCGGADYKVNIVENAVKGTTQGMSSAIDTFVNIYKYQQASDRDIIQSDGAMCNTYFHELTHIILDTMGEFELGANEKFVNCFAGFLTEIMRTSDYELNGIK